MEQCRSPTIPKKLTLPPSKPIYINKRSHPTYPVGAGPTSANKLLHRLLQDNECSNSQSILMQCSKIRPEYLGSFVYNDHITNQGMLIGDDVMFYNCNYSPNHNNATQCNNNSNSISNVYAKLRYSHKDNYSISNDISISNSNANLNSNQNVQINTSCATIKECFDLMKSTRKFHLNSLQARNYKNRVFKDKCKINVKQKSKELNKQNDRCSSSSFNSFSINSNNSNFNHKFEQQYQQQDYAKMARTKLQKYLKKRQNQQQNFKKDKHKLTKMLENSFSQNRVGDAKTNQKYNEMRENKRKLSYKQQNKVKQEIQNNNQNPPYYQKQRQRNRLTFPSWNKQISTKDKQQNQQIMQQYKQFQKQKSISQVKTAQVQNCNDDQNANLNAKQNNQKKLKKKWKNKPKTKTANRPLCYSSNSNSKLALSGNGNANEQFVSKWQQKQKELIQSTNNQLRYFIRKNGQFLVTPDLSKRLLRRQQNTRLNNTCWSTNARDKSTQIQMRDRYKQNMNKLRMSTISMTRQKHNQQYCSTTPEYFNPSQLQQYKFPCPQIPQMPVCPISASPPASPKHPLICQIQHNNYFKIEIQLSLQPSLLYVKQPTNDNNLLHVCVMNGRYEIFMMIVGKCEQYGVDLLKQRNKYGRNPVQLGKLLEFFKYGDGQTSGKGKCKMWDKM